MSEITFGYILFAVDFFLRGYFCIRIVRRRLPVGVSWAWISIILFFPIAGTILYLILGEYRLGARRVRRLRAADEAIRSLVGHSDSRVEESKLEEPARSFALGMKSLFDFPLLSGNDIELLENADVCFEHMIRDVDAAKTSCDMVFFIWSDGGRADDYGRALIRAAQRGVKVRLLVDQVGSSEFIRGPMARELKAAGVTLREALPSGVFRSLLARPDLRIHRKIIVIDGSIGYTGSLNLADPVFFKRDAGVGQWVDALCRLKGPGVQSLSHVFLSDWCVETGENFLAVENRSEFKDIAVTRKTQMQCLPSGPAVHWSSIEEAMIMAIYAARKELVLTTPYFIPNEALLYALMSSARRGVAVTLIVPKVVDSTVIHYACRAFLQDLLEAGVRVALYRDGLLHTKSVTVDRQFSIFGSLNLDPRSLRINFEISLAIYDREFTEKLRALQETYLGKSENLDLATCQAQTKWQMFREDLARLAGPLL